jgi:hypothetical protein
MIGAGVGLLGLTLLGLAVVMFLAAIPRHGEVVGFLRGRDNVQALYGLAFVAMVFVGGALITFSITR